MKTLKFWIGLIIILVSLYVYYLGYSIHLIDPKVDRTGFVAAIWKHVGYASLLFVPVALFLVLRQQFVGSIAYQKWELWSLRLFQITFGLKLITGPLTVWARGSTWKVFDWFGIPSPVERMDGPYEFLETFHKFLGYPLVLFFTLLLIIMGRQIIRKANP